MLTGHASLEAVVNAINNANLYRYVSKPWEKEDLHLTVKQAIESFYKDRQLEEKNKTLRELNDSLEIKVKKRTEELTEALSCLKEREA
jgi:response regulator RpfG family c-di-GMP phosphodiesterase